MSEASENETVADIVKEMRGIKGGQHTNGGLSFERWRARCQFADDYADRIKAAHKRELETRSIIAGVSLADAMDAEHKREVASLRAKLKVAEDALVEASDAFRFCIEQCELELGPKMIGKLCDDGKSVERALAAIREDGGES